MPLKRRFFAFFLAFSILLFGCSHRTVTSNTDTAFRNFTLQLFRQEVSSSTLNLHYTLREPNNYGISDSVVTLGSFDYNPTQALTTIENTFADLRKFPYHDLSKENQITYDILQHYFSSLQNGANYYLYEEPLSPVTGIHAQLPILLAEYSFHQREDVDTYLALLQTLPSYFASLSRFEEKKAEAGLFMADNIADEVISQCKAFVSMGEENYLYSTFEARIETLTDFTPAEKDQYRLRNREMISSYVLPAYRELASSIDSLKGTNSNTGGLCNLPDGSNYYTYLVATETGSSRTIPELKDLIQNQIATDILDSQKCVSTSSSTISYSSPTTLLDVLKTKMEPAFPDVPTVNVKVKYVPSALEQYLSPAFYLIPPIDGYSDNTIYINQAYSLDEIHLFTTLAHEGYPGHLYQTTYYASTDPDPIRTLLSFPGYVEGWATYAEMCSYSISPLDKSYASFLQKNGSAILGLYAMADIGIHYDGWTLSDALSFFSTYGITEEETVQEIYNYIIGDPANYLKYYVGYVEILELKKDMSFSSQKEFHEKLLELGPAPFDIIRKYLMGT